jgi:hypothetical protein
MQVKLKANFFAPSEAVKQNPSDPRDFRQISGIRFRRPEDGSAIEMPDNLLFVLPTSALVEVDGKFIPAPKARELARERGVEPAPTEESKDAEAALRAKNEDLSALDPERAAAEEASKKIAAAEPKPLTREERRAKFLADKAAGK